MTVSVFWLCSVDPEMVSYNDCWYQIHILSGISSSKQGNSFSDWLKMWAAPLTFGGAPHLTYSLDVITAPSGCIVLISHSKQPCILTEYYKYCNKWNGTCVLSLLWCEEGNVSAVVLGTFLCPPLCEWNRFYMTVLFIFCECIIVNIYLSF